MKKSGYGWLALGVAVAAALGGAGWGLWQWVGGQEGRTVEWMQTGWLRVWTAWLGGAAALGWGGWMAWGRKSADAAEGWRRAAWWGGVALLAAWGLRFATADMAFNSIVRPDGVHFATGAEQLVLRGALVAPTRGTDLPLRTLPGPSALFAASQWMAPGNLGAGVYMTWLCSGLMIWAGWWLGRRLGGKAAGWWAGGLIALSPALGWYSRQVMSEVPWGLLVLVSAGWLALAWEGRRGGLAALAGVVGGVGMSVKSSHLLLLAGLAGALAWEGWAERKSGRGGGWKVWAGFVVGTAAGVLPALWYNKAVLGGWLATAYHVYWPGWANATTALNVKYLFSPPLINPTFGLGNVPYYALALAGGEVRPERLILLPGVLLAAGWIWWAGRRGKGGGASAASGDGVAKPAGARGLFVRAAWCAGGLYGVGCLLYSFQEPRFLLPAVPLAFTACALGLGAASERVFAGRWRWVEALVAAVLAGEAALGAAIVLTEAGVPVKRESERAALERLAERAGDFDLLVSDEDPLLLTKYLRGRVPFLPMLLPGELWFPSDAGRMEALMREKRVAVEPFEGTVPLVWRALREGKRVGVYIRKPSARAQAWKESNTAFALDEVEDAGLPRPLWEAKVRGRFRMGTDLGSEAGNLASAEDDGSPAFSALNRARPAHEVVVAPYLLGRREVSNGEYAQFLAETEGVEVRGTDAGFTVGRGGEVWVSAETGSADCGLEAVGDGAVGVRAGMAEAPVVFVTWAGAAEYCNWLSRRDGLEEAYGRGEGGELVRRETDGWRLPTEAEWECAASWDGSEKRTYEWGEEYRTGGANLVGRCVGTGFGGGHLRAGVETGNALGCEELTGNAWEWCQDWYADYTEGEAENPMGPPEGEMKVLRGGSWRSLQGSAYAAYRGLAPPEVATDDIGFRVARDLWRLP